MYAVFDEDGIAHSLQAPKRITSETFLKLFQLGYPEQRWLSQTTPLLISLKPYYSDLIFEGLKKAELRRRFLTDMKGRDVFIYVTSPVMELRGGFRVGQVWTGTPEEIWETVSESAGVDKHEFDAYYAGQSTAYALEITRVWQYANPLPLSALRDLFQNFVVPQSWRYVKPEEYQSFRK